MSIISPVGMDGQPLPGPSKAEEALAKLHAAINNRDSHESNGNAACVLDWIESAKETMGNDQTLLDEALRVLRNLCEACEADLANRHPEEGSLGPEITAATVAARALLDEMA